MCPACSTAELAATSYIRGVLADGINDPELRAQWRHEGGLCAQHWQLLSRADSPALPAAILARDLLERGLRTSATGADNRPRTGFAGLATRSAPKGRACPACAIAVKSEKLALGRLNRLRLPASGLGDTRGFVCLAHLEQLRNEPLRQAVLERLEAMLDELDEFVRKSDYRFADEAKGDERDAWVRAIRVLSGPR